MGFLLEGGLNGNSNYGVEIAMVNNNYYIKLVDFEKARQGVGDLLNYLQVVKSTGNASTAAEIFDRFGTRINPEWRQNIRERAAKIMIPNSTAFVFPRLEPIMEGDEIRDVNLYVDEDLTTQQLRMSRLRFNKNVPE